MAGFPRIDPSLSHEVRWPPARQLRLCRPALPSIPGHEARSGWSGGLSSGLGATAANIADQYDWLANEVLSPLQFRGIIAREYYRIAKFNRVPKHIIVEGEDSNHVFTVPLGGLTGGSLWDPLVPQEFEGVLALLLGVPVERVRRPGGHVTFLRNQGGGLQDVPFNARYE